MNQTDEALKQAFVNLDKNRVQSLVDESVGGGRSPGEILNVLTQGMAEIGELFSTGKLFIPDLVFSGQIFEMIMQKLAPHNKDKTDYQQE